MRALSYIVLSLALLLFALAAYDEYRGVTTAPIQLLRRRHVTWGHSMPVFRDRMPEVFRQFMNTHWTRATVVALAGIILFALDRISDSTDPYSPESDKTMPPPDEPDETQKDEEGQEGTSQV
jgi:hypothetical protein